MILRSLLVAIILLFPIDDVDSYSTGAGSCDGNKPAVGGSHLTASKIVNVSLSQLQVEVSVGPNQYVASSRIPLNSGVNYSISVNAFGGDAFFRGLLIRLEALDGQDLTAALLPGPQLQSSQLCPPPTVVGVTHMDSSIKKSLEASFFMEQAGSVAMDITVVVTNEGDLSLYGFDTYTLDVADGNVPSTSAPLSAPVVSPTFAPGGVVTGAPVISPITTPSITTAVPVINPTTLSPNSIVPGAPTNIPILATTLPTTFAPTTTTPFFVTPIPSSRAPTMAPILLPSSPIITAQPILNVIPTAMPMAASQRVDSSNSKKIATDENRRLLSPVEEKDRYENTGHIRKIHT